MEKNRNKRNAPNPPWASHGQAKLPEPGGMWGRPVWGHIYTRSSVPPSGKQSKL